MATVTGQSFWVGGLPFILALFSFCTSFWMLYKIRELTWMDLRSQMMDPKKNYMVTILTNHVFYMMSGALMVSISLMLAYLSFFINGKIIGKNSQLCEALGVFSNFGAVSTSVWYGAMMWCNLLILKDKKRKIIEQLSMHRKLCLSVIIICAFIPLIGNAYGGMTDNANANIGGVECWINKRMYFLTNYIPQVMALLFTFGLIGYSKYQSFMVKNLTIRDNNDEEVPQPKKTNKHARAVMNFAVVFIIVWGLPLGTRTYQVIKKEIHFIWHIFHHICVASYGLANFIVWKRYLQKHANEIVNNDKNTSTTEMVGTYENVNEEEQL